jgi:hypothetical protein
MKKPSPRLWVVLALLALGVYLYWPRPQTRTTPYVPFTPDAKNPLTLLPNLAFSIDGRDVWLFEGRTQEKDDSGNVLWQTGLTAHQAAGDLNGDGRDDAAAVIVRAGGARGSFYYLVAALAGRSSGDKPPVARATNTYFLGPSIQVQQFEVASGKIHVYYLAYAPGDKTDSPPSLVEDVRFVVQGEKDLVPLE